MRASLPATLLLADMPDSVFDEIIAVDLPGVFLCMKYEIRHMLQHPHQGARTGVCADTADAERA